MTEKQIWDEYIEINPNADKYEAWSFGGTTADMPNILAGLVLKGKKTAAAGAYPRYQYENEPLPLVGGYNIILNKENEAICITKTTKVSTVPFCDVSAEHAYKEGEGNRSLEFWRDCHAEFFTQELQEMGELFSEDMLVVCEEFEVVYPIK